MKTPRIAILVDTATGWGRRLVGGVLEYAHQWGPWDLSIEPQGRTGEFSLPMNDELDGVIARISNPELAEELASSNLPVVNVSNIIVPSYDFPRVAMDLQAMAEMAVVHFRDRGLKHFGYIGPLHLDYVKSHERAFEHTLAAEGLKCHNFPVDQGGAANEIYWHPKQPELIAWLKTLPKPLGLYCWGSEAGRDVIRACNTADLQVPHDIAVLGGDYDKLLSTANHPALSGILTPAQEIGYEGASLLHSLLKGHPSPREDRFLAPQRIMEHLSTEVLAIDDPQILQALTFLRTHACADIQVEDLLKEVPMARRSMERRFMKLLGRSPAQEIRRIRIERARTLLADSNLSIPDIAEACGYVSYTYFGNLFKKETGLSPGRYRKQTQGLQSPPQ